MAGTMGADITRAALIIVDMQNDFLHRDGNFSPGDSLIIA